MKVTKILSTIIIAALCVMALAGCSVGSGTQFGTYPNADKYSVGDAVINKQVDAIDIDYPSGRINVVTHSDSTVSITETSSVADLDDDLRVHWWLDGTTLRIKYSAPNAGQGAFVFSFTPNLNKELTVELPEDAALSDLSIDASSADINAGGFDTQKTDIDTSSGNIVLSQTGKAGSVRLNASSGSITAELGALDSVRVGTSSGDIKIRQSGRCGSASFNASSGEITASLGNVGTLSAGSSSGRITLAAKSASQAKANASSGDISCSFDKTPDELDIDASSGSVKVLLPEDAGFTAKIDTASGKINCRFYALTDSDGTYTVGDGSARISIDTSSGDVTLSSGN